MQSARFADLSKGFFYLVAAVSMIISMLMFVFVWQPVWTSGFKDFHAVSGAISELNKTISPSAEVAPLLLVEIRSMNKSMGQIEKTMHAVEEIKHTMVKMNRSMTNLEDLNPIMVSMSNSVDKMGWILADQMSAMNYEVDRMGNKLSPMGMMPFNW